MVRTFGLSSLPLTDTPQGTGKRVGAFINPLRIEFYIESFRCDQAIATSLIIDEGMSPNEDY